MIDSNYNFLCNTVKLVLNGISRVQNIFPLKPGFRLIKAYYDSHGTWIYFRLKTIFRLINGPFETGFTVPDNGRISSDFSHSLMWKEFLFYRKSENHWPKDCVGRCRMSNGTACFTARSLVTDGTSTRYVCVCAVKAWTVFARSNSGIVGSNPTRGMDVCVRLFCVFAVLCAGSGLATG
jgi:hypothetical protein